MAEATWQSARGASAPPAIAVDNVVRHDAGYSEGERQAMGQQARVVVIGGGVVGVSVLYHLARAGWSEVVLLERAELTSGSTWHAAGGFHTLNGDPNVARLQRYTIDLYREIEELSGQSCGLHLTGGVMLAGTSERMDWLRMAHARGRYLGMDTELISAREAADIMPLIDPACFVGAMLDPLEGHLDPSGVTHAYARSAQKLGATIRRRQRVQALRPRSDGGWDVVTADEVYHAEHVVNAAGLWAREVGHMAGVQLPVLAMEHMYLLTDDMPEVVDYNQRSGREIPHVIDFEGEIYLRQEGRGMLMGTYEQAGRPWALESTPWDFDTELLPPDIDRIAPSLEVGFRHFPAFAKAGIKQVINGPFTFAPDGNPLIGPVRGLSNYWAAVGVMAGFSQGGGVGLALANWMVDGDPGFDVWAMDIARFGDFATPAYTRARVEENYARRFRIRYPNEELPAGRPLKTTPLYPRLHDRGAVFGASFGLEQPLWFAPGPAQAGEQFSFRRSTDFNAVAGECRAVREAVGVCEISGFANYEIDGPAAAEWLDGLLANHLPPPGRMVLCPMLNDAGHLVGDFTAARLGPQRFLLTGSGPAEQYHARWFEARLVPGVVFRAASADYCGLHLAGPRSRELLARITGTKLDNEHFRFLSIAPMEVGMVPALVGRVSYTGSLGYEIWVRPEYLLALHDAVLEAGEGLGLRHFGSRALNSLRLEKNYGSWAREYRPVYTPLEAGLDRFVAPDKGMFTGRDALLAAAANGPLRRLANFVIDAGDADALGDEPILRDGEVVGQVTSGGHAHHAGKSMAMGYLRADALDPSADYQVEIIGEFRPARMQPEPLFDPDGRVLRG